MTCHARQLGVLTFHAGWLPCCHAMWGHISHHFPMDGVVLLAWGVDFVSNIFFNLWSDNECTACVTEQRLEFILCKLINFLASDVGARSLAVADVAGVSHACGVPGHGPPAFGLQPAFRWWPCARISRRCNKTWQRINSCSSEFGSMLRAPGDYTHIACV